MSNTALSILEHTFGYSGFRGAQADIIETVAAGSDALVVMPTGGGKSLCYQIPSLMRSGVGVVVSPLIALMQDQVSALKNVGVSAEFLNSTLDFQTVANIERALHAGVIDILYIAPERLIQDRTLQLLSQCDIALFAIDEAHCVSQWGHDFRADYLKLDVLQAFFSNVPRMALTATADDRTRGEIIERLGLNDARQFISGFDRPNIQYRIVQKDKPKQQLLRFLAQEQEGNAGIVYCLSRDKVEKTAVWLCENGFEALPYHAGFSAQTRAEHQSRFLREDSIIMVATIAFGMGIDKPDVRFVAHLDMPKSVEAYYQETGRAGRDGEPATALLLYGFEDVVKLRQMSATSEGNEMFRRHEQQRINAMLGLCELATCRRQALLQYFGDSLPESCGNCDTCLAPPETWDATEASRMALSCVYRTGQRFGSAHVIDVLRGNITDKVTQFQHDKLSTFAIGESLSANDWRSVLRQLTARGYLDVDHEGYGSLQLTEKCRALLRGEDTIELRRDIKVVGGKNKKSQRASADIEERDIPLWNALRACRKRLSEEFGVPPYVVFHDATLKDMILKRPSNSWEMLSVSGVGDAKLERFGHAFLDVLRDFEFGDV